MMIHASVGPMDASTCFGSLGHLPSDAKVRSTTQRPTFFSRFQRYSHTGDDMQQSWPPVADGFQAIGRAIAILDVGAVNHEADHQTKSIEYDKAVTAFDLLACVIAPVAAAFCGFTLWLSMAPVVGRASLPCNTRASITR